MRELSEADRSLADTITAAESAADANATFEQLRDLRDTLSKNRTQRQFASLFRRIHNDQQAIDDLHDDLMAASQRISDRILELESLVRHYNVLGVGGGSSVAASAMVAAATTTAPLLALVLVPVGGYVAFRGLGEIRQLRGRIFALQEIRAKLIDIAGQREKES